MDMILMCLSVIRSKVRVNLTDLLQEEFIHNSIHRHDKGDNTHDTPTSESNSKCSKPKP